MQRGVHGWQNSLLSSIRRAAANPLTGTECSVSGVSVWANPEDLAAWPSIEETVQRGVDTCLQEVATRHAQVHHRPCRVVAFADDGLARGQVRARVDWAPLVTPHSTTPRSTTPRPAPPQAGASGLAGISLEALGDLDEVDSSTICFRPPTARSDSGAPGAPGTRGSGQATTGTPVVVSAPALGWLNGPGLESGPVTLPGIGLSLTIGRSSGNHVRVPPGDLLASKLHARITCQVPGQWELIDCGSSNGTVVDGQQITGPVALRDGMRVQIGSTTYVVSFQA